MEAVYENQVGDFNMNFVAVVTMLGMKAGENDQLESPLHCADARK